MQTYINTYYQKAINDIQSIPVEYMPNLLKIINIYKNNISNNTPQQSLEIAWKEANMGNTLPIENLWNDLDD
jgi:hypothetical protein